MYVVPTHRGRGVGELLVGAVTTYADAVDVERIVLNPSPRATPCSRRAGFVPADKLMLRPNRSGPDDSP